LSLRDVGVDRQDIFRPAGLVAKESPTAQCVRSLARLCVLNQFSGPESVSQTLLGGLVEIRSVAVQQRGDFSSDSLLSGPAVHLLRPRIPIADRVVQTSNQNGVVGVVQKFSLFGYARFRFLAIGNVVDRADEIGAAPASIKDGCDADFAIL